MSTSKVAKVATPPSQAAPDFIFDWQQTAAALLASKGISKGWWRVGIKLQFAAITARMAEPGKAPAALPTALVGVESVALFATTQGGDMVFDAAKECEPVPAGAVAPASVAARKKIVLRKKAG